MRALTSGLFRTSDTARAIWSTMGFGVWAGANNPCQFMISKSLRPDSSTVGTSGRRGSRAALVTASALTWPDAT